MVLLIAAISLSSSFKFSFYKVLKIRSNYGRYYKKPQSITTKKALAVTSCFYLLKVAGCIKQMSKTFYINICLRPVT